MAKIVVLGNLGADPEERMTKTGKTVVSFSIAENRKRRGAESTAWFHCSVSGAQAQYAKNYLRKGNRVFVIGDLEVSSYVAQNGEKRTSLQVWASDLQNVSLRQDPASEQTSQAAPAQRFDSQAEPVEDSDLPF